MAIDYVFFQRYFQFPTVGIVIVQAMSENTLGLPYLLLIFLLYLRQHAKRYVFLVNYVQ